VNLDYEKRPEKKKRVSLNETCLNLDRSPLWATNMVIKNYSRPPLIMPLSP
jgi:hypothetical protein